MSPLPAGAEAHRPTAVSGGVGRWLLWAPRSGRGIPFKEFRSMVDPEKWYSVKEVSAIVGLGRDTVIRQIQGGFLKAFILPRKKTRRGVYNVYRIRGADVMSWLNAGMGSREAS
jgi:Helix-turn-helix domain